MQNTPQVDKLRWLTLTPELLSQEMAQVAGRISYVGGALATAREELLRAEHERKRTESLCLLKARLDLEGVNKTAKGESKGPTEKQVDSHMRTDPALSAQLNIAVEREIVAEARVETLRADYAAVKVEADLIAEVARNQRAEMQHLNPTVYAQPLQQQTFQRVPTAEMDVPWARLRLIPDKRCSVCKLEVRQSPSGTVCEAGHGGAPLEDAEPDPSLLQAMGSPPTQGRKRSTLV